MFFDIFYIFPFCLKSKIRNWKNFWNNFKRYKLRGNILSKLTFGNISHWNSLHIISIKPVFRTLDFTWKITLISVALLHLTWTCTRSSTSMVLDELLYPNYLQLTRLITLIISDVITHHINYIQLKKGLLCGISY